MPIRLFLSYAHRDEAHKERLCAHLAGLRQKELISDWHDRKIIAGENWAQLIDQNLKSADIVLMLVSANFTNSDYCYGIELKTALEREARGEATVVPIIVNPVDWEHLPFGRLQALPKDARPVTKWSNREEAWSNVAKGVRKLVEALNEENSAKPIPSRAPVSASPPVPLPADPKLASVAPRFTPANLAKVDVYKSTGMSRLLRAIHPTAGPVVVKYLLESTIDSDRWRASDGYRTALGERLVEAGIGVDSVPYVVLRFIEGICLGEVVAPGNVIRGALLDHIVMQLLQQLRLLNRASPTAVHRDVTPGNLILSLHHGQAVVRLIDYESGCLAGEAQTPVRAYGFTAPEQSHGAAVPSSDLYALAASVYFLATGDIPAPNQAHEYPPETFGDFTEFSELYPLESFKRFWSEEAQLRPASAEEFLQQRRTPGTRAMRKPKELGRFDCSSDLSFELFDQYYTVVTDAP